MLVKRGAVDLRLIGHILYGYGLQIPFRKEFAEGLQDQVAVRLTRGSSFSSLGFGNILAPVLFIQQICSFDG